MPQPNEAIASARVKLFIVPPESVGGDPLPLGLVEDFSATNQYYPENFRTVGEPIPPDNVLNFAEGRVRWGQVYQANDLNQIIAPRIAEFTGFESYDLLALDPVDNKPLKLARGCLPESIDFNARGGVSARQNYTGLCRVVLDGPEIQQALAA